MDFPLDKICRQVCRLAEETGVFVLKQRRKILSSYIKIKSPNSFVTFVDEASERRLVRGLKKILPEAAFLTEEKTVLLQRKKYTWIIDPLDGTTNFIHGVPCYCISVALYVSSPHAISPFPALMKKRRNGEVLLGVIYEPNLKELFYAIKGSGAFLNTKRIAVSKTKQLKNSLLITGFPTYDYSKMDEYIALFRQLMKRTRGLRRMGSAAVDLAYVACGRFDAFYEYSLNAWDVAAGALLVQEAGGEVSDFSGKNNFLYGREIIASNGLLHMEMISAVKKFFK